MLFWLGGDWESFISGEGDEDLRETLSEFLGSLVNEKSRPRPGTNVGCP